MLAYYTPTVRVRCDPATFPCPTCGQPGRRKQILTRIVHDFHQHQRRDVELTYAEYRATCACVRTFRSHPDPERLPMQPRAQYSDRIRELLLARLLQDGMSGEHTLASLQRDFGLDLSDGFLDDCLKWKVQTVDMAAYRQFTRERFSGVLCVDELHLGRRVLLLATDPLNDLVIGFALVSHNDQAHMHGFLNNLKNHGFAPELVITDGSLLYPQVLRDVWPKARHQLCVFHLLQDLNQALLDAVRRLRQQAFPKPPRRPHRGRPSRHEQATVQREQELQERSTFIWQHRYLIVKRPENYEGSDAQDLQQMLAYLPGLRTLRELALEIMALFDPTLRPRQVGYRYRRWYTALERVTDGRLRKALQSLNPAKFRKVIAHRVYSHRRQTRTNNHVERQNRHIRLWEKVRYGWRRRRTIVRFVILALAAWQANAEHDEPPPKKRLRRRRK